MFTQTANKVESNVLERFTLWGYEASPHNPRSVTKLYRHPRWHRFLYSTYRLRVSGWQLVGRAFDRIYFGVVKAR